MQITQKQNLNEGIISLMINKPESLVYQNKLISNQKEIKINTKPLVGFFRHLWLFVLLLARLYKNIP